MKKSMMLALLGLLFMGGTNAYAQDDSVTMVEEPKDTISIDTMDPTFYEEEAPKESSNATTYAIIGGIVVIGGVAYFFMKKKK